MDRDGEQTGTDVTDSPHCLKIGFLDRLRTVSEWVRSALSGTATDESRAVADPFDLGEIVRDQEQDGKQLLVIGTHDANASAFTVPGTDETVASYNPDYPPADRVIEVRFVESFDAYLGEWTVADVLDREARDELNAGNRTYPESWIAEGVDADTKSTTVANGD